MMQDLLGAAIQGGFAQIMTNLSYIGVFASTVAMTLFLFRYFDRVVAEVSQRHCFVRILLAVFNGFLGAYGISLYHNDVPAVLLILVLDFCFVMEYAAISNDRMLIYIFLGSSVFFNNLMIYTVAYSVSRFFLTDITWPELYQSGILIAANLVGALIVVTYHLPIFPTAELKRLMHSPESLLLNIWFPVISTITFFNVLIILPTMNEGLSLLTDWLASGREVAFYTIILEWAVLMMSSSYLVLFYQTGQIRLMGDILEQKQKASLWKERAIRHPLTDLYNRKSWEKMVRRYLDRGEGGYLIMIDLDHFKEVNDNLGHQEGDRVLKETADMMRRTFRPNDIIGHVGGDEFCVFMAGDFDEAIVDERLQQLMDLRREELPCKYGGTFMLSLSAGYAAVQAKYELEDLLAAADAALYWQKEHGRNGFTAFRPDMWLQTAVSE